MTRAERRRLEREQSKGTLTIDEMQRVKIAYNIFTEALEKALPNAGVGKAARDKIIQEMHYAMAEMEGKPIPRNQQIVINDSEYQRTLRMSNIERQEFMQLNLAVACIISAADVLTAKGICTKEEKTWLKTAHTWLHKAVAGITARLADDEMRKQREFVEAHEFAMFDKEKDRDLIKQELEEGKKVYLSKDQFCDFADKAILANCGGCEKNYKACDLYRIQWEIGIDPVQFYKEGCPYKYAVKEG